MEGGFEGEEIEVVHLPEAEEEGEDEVTMAIMNSGVVYATMKKISLKMLQQKTSKAFQSALLVLGISVTNLMNLLFDSLNERDDADSRRKNVVPRGGKKSNSGAPVEHSSASEGKRKGVGD